MKLISSNRFYLPGTDKKWLHIATVTNSVREYMCFADVATSQIYIEEITGGSLSFIEDESLAKAIHNFLVYKKVLLMDRPLLSDADWFKKQNENK